MFVSKITPMEFNCSKTGLSIILMSLLLLIVVLWWLRKRKPSRKLVVKEMALGSGILVFLPYRGKYSEISYRLKEIEKDVSEFFDGNLKYFGVYYDDATKVVDQSSCRAILGICLDRKNGSIKKPTAGLSTSSNKESDASMYEVTGGMKPKMTLRSSVRGSDAENAPLGGSAKSIKASPNKGVVNAATDLEDVVAGAVKARVSTASVKTSASAKKQAQSTYNLGTAAPPAVKNDKKTTEAKKDLINDIVVFLNSHRNYKTVNFTNLKGFGAVLPYSGVNDLKSGISKGFAALREYGVRKKQMDRCGFSMHISDEQNKTLTVAFPYFKNSESLADQSGYPAPKLKE